MLPPDDRVVLVDALRPPPGMELVHGVATTFTLDLTSALVVPLSLAAQNLSEAGSDPVAVLSAIRKAADRFDIFCQVGQITVPSPYTPLVEFLDEMVHEVTAPKPGGLFHPKVWLLEFSDGSDLAYRLLCSTRNLTGDRSWDLLVRLDGVCENGPSVNADLVTLIQRLPEWTSRPLSADRASRLRDLAGRVRHVAWDCPAGVNFVEFHMFGLPGRRTRPDFSGARHLVISPFVTADGLLGVAPDDSRSVQVVSRVENLDRLPPSTLERLDATYVIDDAAGLDVIENSDAEASEGATTPGLLSGLHAKAVVIEQGQSARVLIGSMNATSGGLRRNVEFMVELGGTRSKLGIDTMLDADAGFRQVLTPYAAKGGQVPTADDKADHRLEVALRDLATHGFRATVVPDGDRYTVDITTQDELTIADRLEAAVALMSLPAAERVIADASGVRFATIDLLYITPFLVLRVTDERGEQRRCVVRAELTGDPPGRHDELLARQIDTPEKFLRLLMLLLSLGTPGGASFLLDAGAGSGRWTSCPTGVFETLVRALAMSPGGLDDFAPFVERLRRAETSSSVLPEGFDELWDLVWSARQQLVTAT